MKKQRILAIVIFLSGILGVEAVLADVDARAKVIEFVRSVGLEDQLTADVTVSADVNGVISIADEGKFFMQYVIVEPNVSADANVVIEPDVKIPSSANKAVIVTHGWIDKAASDWPAEIAKEIRKKIDPNEWFCGFFDWRGGAAVPNPVDAAKYGRDIAGPRLAKALLELNPKLEHVHLIAHSAGCWTINSASKIIAEKTDAQIHLTFLDAYVPPFWDEGELGKSKGDNLILAEHYYTKDITLGCTQKNLSAAHNVDITQIDPIFAEHKFPYRWYLATIAGKYRDSDAESGDKVLTEYKGLDYGFSRSFEAGLENWEKSLALKKGGKAVRLNRKKKKLFNLKDMKWPWEKK